MSANDNATAKASTAGRTKQVIVIRRNLGLRRGKEIAQGAHASMAFLTRRLERDGYRGARISLELTVAEDDDLAEAGGQPFLQVPDEAGLLRVYEAAREAGLEVNLITDSGRTEFHGVPTMTAVALGPDYDEKIDPVTGGLELY